MSDDLERHDSEATSGAAPAAPEARPDGSVRDPAPTGLSGFSGRLPRHGLTVLVHSLQLDRFSGFVLWGVFIAIFALWVPNTFLTWTTVRGIMGEEPITAILALGLLFALAAGVFDLSIGNTLNLGAVVCAALMTTVGMSPVPAVLITLLMGAGVGAVNGILVAWVGIGSFIATLGTSSVLLALIELISNFKYVGPVPQSFQTIATTSVDGVPIVFIYMVVVAILAWFFLEHTPWGRRVRATGSGPEAARLAGVRTRWYVFWTLVVSGTVASLAGVLFVGRIGIVGPNVGASYLLPTFAACFLGTTQIRPGRFNVWGTLLALFLLATGIQGLQLAGGQLWISDLFNGVALVTAVGLSVYATRRRAARQKQRTEAA